MSWTYAILLGLISSIVSYIVFLLLEVFLADILKENLRTDINNNIYSNVSIILITGILFIFISNFIVNLLYTQFVFEPKLIANLISFGLSFLLIYLISWISILIKYPTFSSKNILEQFLNSDTFFPIFSIYILQAPILFWVLTNIIYNLILIVNMRFFYIDKKKVRKENLSENKQDIKSRNRKKRKYIKKR